MELVQIGNGIYTIKEISITSGRNLFQGHGSTIIKFLSSMHTHHHNYIDYSYYPKFKTLMPLRIHQFFALKQTEPTEFRNSSLRCFIRLKSISFHYAIENWLITNIRTIFEQVYCTECKGTGAMSCIL